MTMISTLWKLWSTMSISTLWKLWSVKHISSLWRLKRKSHLAKQPSTVQLPREIIEQIMLMAVTDNAQPKRNDKQARTHAHVISQLLLIDHATHNLLRHELRMAKEDMCLGNPECRASRVIEAAFLDTIFGQPDPMLFHDFEAALGRWWPLNSSQPVYLRTCRQVRQLITAKGRRINIASRETIAEFTHPLNCIVRVTKVPQHDTPTHFCIATLDWDPTLTHRPNFYGPSGPYFIITRGTAYATLVCQVLFSFVRSGDTIKLQTCGMPPGIEAASVVRPTAYDFQSKVQFNFDDDLGHIMSEDDMRFFSRIWRDTNGPLLSWIDSPPADDDVVSACDSETGQLTCYMTPTDRG